MRQRTLPVAGRTRTAPHPDMHRRCRSARIADSGVRLGELPMTTGMRRSTVLVAALALVALTLTACGTRLTNAEFEAKVRGTGTGGNTSLQAGQAAGDTGDTGTDQTTGGSAATA